MAVSIWRMPRTEQVFTFKDDKLGELYHFAVDQLNAYIRSSSLKPEPVILHAEMVSHLAQRGGAEYDHLVSLPDEAMQEPCTLVEFGDGTHILADGVHRVLKRAMAGHEDFMAYIVPERIWRRFLIVDVPDQDFDWDTYLTTGSRNSGPVVTPKIPSRMKSR